MASISKISNKKGFSYRITVSRGFDAEGKNVRHTKTWSPPVGITEKKADKQAQKIAFEFEQSIISGYVADDHQTFARYSEYVLNLKEHAGVKQKTLDSYRYLLRRVNAEIGNLKLADIRPSHLNKMYRKLSLEGLRETGKMASAKDADAIKMMLKCQKLSHAKAGILAGLSYSTVDAICLGKNVEENSAKKFCEVFDLEFSKSFNLSTDARPLSSKTIREYHNVVSCILGQAEKEMLVPYNAASKSEPPKVKQREVNYFQPDELIKILEAVKSEPLKWQVIINLLAVSGARRGEIAALKWHNIDFQSDNIKIDSTLLYSSKKGIFENATKTGDTRFLKVPHETILLLKEYRLEYLANRMKLGELWEGTVDYCFVQNNGKPIIPDSITAWCRYFSGKHPELPHLNPHAFRHSVASILISNKTDIVSVSKRLGHSRTSTTEDIYAHLIAEADANASECIAEVLLRKHA